MTHLETAEIEEVSNSILGKLIKETRNIVVIFCKYIAYAIIALTHTCYLIKNYAPDDLKKYLPPQAVRGMASETWLIKNIIFIIICHHIPILWYFNIFTLKMNLHLC